MPIFLPVLVLRGAGLYIPSSDAVQTRLCQRRFTMREPGKLHWLAIVVVSGVCLAVIGCGESKINKANFDRISKDMSEEEVDRILGKGEEQAEINMPHMGINVPDLGGGGVGRAKVKTWQDGSKKIFITFRNDKVVSMAANGL